MYLQPILKYTNKFSTSGLAAEDYNQATDLIKNSIHEALEELSGDGIPTEYAERTETSTRAVETTNRTEDI